MTDEAPYTPCTAHGCGRHCEMWEEGNPNGCYGEARAAGEVETDAEGEGGWRWVHGCEKHMYEVM